MKELTKMKRIKLTQSKFALVDDEDFDYLNQYKWYAHNNGQCWYALRSVREDGKVKTFRVHQEIMGLRIGDKKEVDHINHNGLDNRKSNLRICSRSQNQGNRNKCKSCSSKYKGVSWHKNCEKWQVRITKSGKHYYLGRFDSEIESAKVYDKAAKKMFGKFAKCNF